MFFSFVLAGSAAFGAASCGLPGAESSGPAVGGAGSTVSSSSGRGGAGATGGSSVTSGGANGGSGGGSVSTANTGGSMATASSSTGPAPVCGNHVVEAGEQCDDGNLQPGDRCSATCQVEHPDVCPGTSIPLGPGTFTINDDTSTSTTDNVNTAGGPGTGCPAGAYPGVDLVYAVTPTQSGTITAKLTATYANHYVHVRSDCPGVVDIACAYDGAANTTDTVTFAATQGTVYIVIVDSWQSQAGPFTLTLTM